MDDHFYYDTLRINTILSPETLKELIDTKEIVQHVRKIEIKNASQFAKIHGFKGCIVLSQASDKAITILQRYDLDKHSIVRIEVARDLRCNNFLSRDKHLGAAQHLHHMKYARERFDYKTSTYIGKKKGKKTGTYTIIYPPKIKCGEKNRVHSEFVLQGNKNILKKLDINSIYDLGKAKDHYHQLDKKFIIRGEINHKRFNKHFPDIKIKDIRELAEFLLKRKKAIKDFLKINKKHVLKNSEKLILNQGIPYFLMKK
jgi:hypothetical protein